MTNTEIRGRGIIRIVAHSAPNRNVAIFCNLNAITTKHFHGGQFHGERVPVTTSSRVRLALQFTLHVAANTNWFDRYTEPMDHCRVLELSFICCKEMCRCCIVVVSFVR